MKKMSLGLALLLVLAWAVPAFAIGESPVLAAAVVLNESGFTSAGNLDLSQVGIYNATAVAIQLNAQNLASTEPAGMLNVIPLLVANNLGTIDAVLTTWSMAYDGSGGVPKDLACVPTGEPYTLATGPLNGNSNEHGNNVGGDHNNGAFGEARSGDFESVQAFSSMFDDQLAVRTMGIGALNTYFIGDEQLGSNSTVDVVTNNDAFGAHRFGGNTFFASNSATGYTPEAIIPPLPPCSHCYGCCD